MVIVTDKQNCCGCGACAQVCPKQCIKMTEDKEGFLYPMVGEDACIDCGLCERVCPELNPGIEREPQKVLAAINKDEAVRLRSSSGGVFYLLAEKFIRDGGVVFGARFDETWQVVMDFAVTLDGVQTFMGSKYVQARTEKAYIDARRFLQNGKKVLFSGTPCQIAGLRRFLNKEYDSLVTVGIVCHGTPSPKVWGRYLEEVRNECGEITGVAFRDKSRGWRNYSFRLSCDKKNVNFSVRKNSYMKAFLKDLILRPACYNCKFKGGRSQSDLTLADFWGVWEVNPQMDDDKGTSIVFVNSDKGERLMADLDLATASSDYETAKAFNFACRKSPVPHRKRAEFFSELDSAGSVIRLMDKYTAASFREKLLRRLRKYLKVN